MSAAKKSAQVETTSLTPSQTATALRLMAPTDLATFVWGPPGIAKSAVGKQVATARGIAFVDIRLSQMDPTDLRGIPVPVNDGVTTGVSWSPPITLPKDIDVQRVIEIDAIDTEISFRNANPLGSNNIHYVRQPIITVRPLNRDHTARIISQTLDTFEVVLEDKDGNPVAGKLQYRIKGEAHAIIAFEEFNSAPPSVQAASYQLILDRMLGEYRVPKGCIMMAMGNRDTDKGVAFKIGPALMNRFTHVEMRSDFDDWQVWALGAMVHPDVVGFLSAFKNCLMQFDAGSAARGWASPRSWEFVSRFLKENSDLPAIESMALIMGMVGDGIGVQFWEFRKIAADLPRADRILSGEIKDMPKDKRTEVSLAYALTTTLCYELKERNDRLIQEQIGPKDFKKEKRMEWFKAADNFLEFIMKNFTPEIAIMGAKAGIQVHKLPFDTQRMKHFETFAMRYKDVIMAN